MTNKKQTLNNLIEEIEREFISCYKDSSLFECWDGAEKDLKSFLRQALIKVAKETAEAGKLTKENRKRLEINLFKLLKGHIISNWTTEIHQVKYPQALADGIFLIYNQAASQQQKQLEEFFKGRLNNN